MKSIFFFFLVLLGLQASAYEQFSCANDSAKLTVGAVPRGGHSIVNLTFDEKIYSLFGQILVSDDNRPQTTQLWDANGKIVGTLTLSEWMGHCPSRLCGMGLFYRIFLQTEMLNAIFSCDPAGS